MDFWASSECDARSDEAVDAVRRSIEPILQEMLDASSLKATQLLLRYVPIVMGPELRDAYPARSKVRLKDRILDCAPQLPNGPFVAGSIADQVRTYVDGIGTAAALLPQFGLSAKDVNEFERLLSKAAERSISDLSPDLMH